MSFSVDGWDPSYGASLELEGQLEESTARIDAGVEVPADRWRPIDPDAGRPAPRGAAVRRRRAPRRGAGLDRRRPRAASPADVDVATGEVQPGDDRPGRRGDRGAVRVLRGGRGLLLRRGRAPRGRRSGAAACSRWRRTRATSSPGRAGTRRIHVTIKRAGRAGHGGALPVAAAPARRGRGGRGQGGPRRGRRRRRRAVPGGHPGPTGQRPADRRRAAAAAASTCNARSATSSRTTPRTCRRSSTRSSARSPPASAPPRSRWAPAGTGTAGTCGCPGRRARRGRAWFASSAPPTCPSTR